MGKPAYQTRPSIPVCLICSKIKTFYKNRQNSALSKTSHIVSCGVERCLRQASTANVGDSSLYSSTLPTRPLGSEPPVRAGSTMGGEVAPASTVCGSPSNFCHMAFTGSVVFIIERGNKKSQIRRRSFYPPPTRGNRAEPVMVGYEAASPTTEHSPEKICSCIETKQERPPPRPTWVPNCASSSEPNHAEKKKSGAIRPNKSRHGV